MKRCLIPALAMLALAGCSKVHEQRSFTLAPLGGNTLSITAPLSEQKVTVVVSSDQPVNVWVLLEKDVPPGDKGDVDPDKMTSGVLAKEKNTKEATLQATVPAKEKYQVYIVNSGTKTASVTVKVDSQ
jgi:Prokaryotic membrane lipoprotein lipid attachment site